MVNIDNNIILGSYKCDFFGYSIFAYLQEDTGVCEQDIDGVAARDLLTTTLSRGKYLDSILNQHGGIRISPLIFGWDRPGTLLSTPICVQDRCDNSRPPPPAKWRNSFLRVGRTPAECFTPQVEFGHRKAAQGSSGHKRDGSTQRTNLPVSVSSVKTAVRGAQFVRVGVCAYLTPAPNPLSMTECSSRKACNFLIIPTSLTCICMSISCPRPCACVILREGAQYSATTLESFRSVSFLPNMWNEGMSMIAVVDPALDAVMR